MTGPVVWDHGMEGDVWLVGTRGRLDHWLVPQLEATLARLVADGRVRLVVDLSHVDYVNSGGLRVLVGTWRAVQRQGGDLCLCGLRRRVQDILETMGFHRIFRFYDEPAEAAIALAASLEG